MLLATRNFHSYPLYVSPRHVVRGWADKGDVMVKSFIPAGLAFGVATGLFVSGANALSSCQDLPDHAALKVALDAAVATETSGLDFDMWATLVNRDGIVCAVAFSGADRGSQWPGSRAISAQKANTANAFS